MNCSAVERLVISVVSHQQADIVADLLSDIAAVCNPSNMTVLVTVNVEERLSFKETDFPFEMSIIQNASPKGFGANHNAAFSRINGDFFCVLNPDIRLKEDPFPPLLRELKEADVGLVAPLIVDPFGKKEDNARRRITPLLIAKRILKVEKGLDYSIDEMPIFPDWVAGMFMLFRSDVFSAVQGFDEGYYMYCEDADICARMWRSDHKISLVPSVTVIHNAQRKSHKNLSHVRWHIASLLRYFSKLSLNDYR